MDQLDIKIYGIHERDFLIDKLKENLNLCDDDIIYDDRPGGGLVLYTLEKALRAPADKNVTHRCVLPDDMICCDNFKLILNKIIKTHPDKVVCLFPYNFHIHESEYIPLSSPYIKNNGLLCGNGLIFPKKIIDPCFKTLHERFANNYDTLREECVLMWYFKKFHIQVINIIPSPVQHIGDDYGSYLPYEVTENRKTGFFKQDCLTGIDWENKEILDFPNYDYSYEARIRDYIRFGKGKFIDKNFNFRKERKNG